MHALTWHCWSVHRVCHAEATVNDIVSLTCVVLYSCSPEDVSWRHTTCLFLSLYFEAFIICCSREMSVINSSKVATHSINERFLFFLFFFFRFFPLLSCLCPHVKSPSYWDSKQVKSNIFGPFFLSNVCVGSITNSAIISRSRNSPTPPPPVQRPSSLIIPKILLTPMQHEISLFHLRPLEILFFYFSFFFLSSFNLVKSSSLSRRSDS